MKQIYIVSALLIVAIVASSNFKINIQSKPLSVSEGESESSERAVWELQRLCDPATGKIPFNMRELELAYCTTLPSDVNLSVAGKNALSWNFRGPWNVGGRTRALALDITNENIMIAGSVSGGLWRTTDGGLTWNRVTGVNTYQGFNAIAQDKRPGHTNNWYALTGEAYGTSASGGSSFYLGNGVYKSTDGGLTWTSLPSTVSNTPQSFDNIWDVTWNLATNPADSTNDVVYAATYGAIFKSLNGGNNWSLMKGNASGSAFSYFTDVAVASTGVVYASLSSDGPSKGIWRSPDGIAWTNILPTGFPAAYDRLKIGIDPNTENIVYFFGPTPNTGKHTFFFGGEEWTSLWKYEYLTGNGQGAGGIWTDLSQNLPNNGTDFNNLALQGGYDIVVKVKPGNSNVIFIGGTNIFRSTSAFTDSVSTDVIGGYEIGAALPFVNEYAGHHPDQHELLFSPSNPDVMISANDGGISKTLDNSASSVVWTELNPGYISSQFYTIAIDHSTTDDIIIGGLQDNGTYFTNSNNGQQPWFHSIDGDGSYCHIVDGGHTYYFSKQNARIAKASVDESTGAMTAYRRMDPIGASGYKFINPFVIDANDSNKMYLAAGHKVYRNDDLSQIALTNQWDSISTNWMSFPDTLTTATESVTAVAISKTPASRLYYGTSNKKIYRIDNCNTGTPASVLITPATGFPANGYVSCIAIDPDDADKVIVVFSNYNIYSVFYTDNGGTAWKKVAGNLEQNPTGSGNGPSCRWAQIMKVTDGTVYAIGTSTGLYMTDTLIDNATVWIKQASAVIGSSIVDMLDYRTTDGLLVAATHGNGVFSTHVTSKADIITSVQALNNQAYQFNIFPNPANDVITVSVDKIPVNKTAKVSIVNEAGLKIKDLHELNLVAGNHFSIPVQNLSGGIYYLVIENEKSKSVKGFLKL